MMKEKITFDEKEFSRLKAREKCCPTMLESEARALLRALQEIADILKLPKDVSPHQVVEHVRGLKPNASGEQTIGADSLKGKEL